MICYTECPICNNKNVSYQLKVKDYTVSQQSFEIWQCDNCTGRFTQNIPEQKSIGEFYKSDNYVSHTDTKKGLVNHLYHRVRKKTLQSKKKLIVKQTNLLRGKILDIGCGTGAFTDIMKQNNWTVTGIEPDENARIKAKELYQLSPLPSEDLFVLNPSDYDAITMWHVLEHVHDLHGYLKKINILLKEKGLVFIAVPNYTSKDAAIYKQYWAAYDVPRHLYHFSPKSMNAVLNQHGMRIKKIKPMWFDSFYVCMLSELNKAGKNNFIKAVWNGFISNWKTLFNTRKCSSIIYVVEKQTTDN